MYIKMLEEQDYLKNLKDVSISKKRNVIISEQSNLEEGFLRGLASEFTNIGEEFKTIGDLFHLGPEKVVPRVASTMQKLKKSLSKIKSLKSVDERGQNPYLKYRQSVNEWRFYYYLQDHVFKRMLDYALKKRKDPVGWFDFNVADRVVRKLYTAKTPQDLMKLADLYLKRVQMVYQLYKKDPENKGLKSFLRQGIHGLRDFTQAVKRFAAYMAKD